MPISILHTKSAIFFKVGAKLVFALSLIFFLVGCGKTTSYSEAIPKSNPDKIGGPSEIQSQVLIDSSKEGNINEVEEALDQGADIDSIDNENKWTPLMWSVWYRHLDIGLLLIDSGANVRYQDDQGTTALSLAVELEYEEFINPLNEAIPVLEPTPTTTTTTTTTPVVIEQPRPTPEPTPTTTTTTTTTPVVIEQPRPTPEPTPTTTTTTTTTPVVIEQPRPTPEPTPTTTTTTTTTPVVIEQPRPTPEPTPTTTTTTTTTPVVIEQPRPTPEPTPQDNRHFCPTDETFNECLIIGSRDGNINKAREALNNKADVNVKDNWGVSALMLASVYGHLEVVKALLAANADVNLRSKTAGLTALFYASSRGHLEIVKVLIEAGANVNIRGSDVGHTALFPACSEGRLEVVKVLLAAGTNVNVQDVEGKTALMLSVANLKIVQALIAAGANVNLQNKHGKTALIYAVYNGYINSVKALIAAGANLDGALDNVCASCSNRNEIIKVLKEAETPTTSPTTTTTTTTTTTPQDNRHFCPTDETFNECLIIGSRGRQYQ